MGGETIVGGDDDQQQKQKHHAKAEKKFYARCQINKPFHILSL
jgi:hypothetical protein